HRPRGRREPGRLRRHDGIREVRRRRHPEGEARSAPAQPRAEPRGRHRRAAFRARRSDGHRVSRALSRGRVVIRREKRGARRLTPVRSQAAGTGAPLSAPAVRAVMLLRANCLAKGFSGVRRQTLELLLACLAKGIHPVIPEQGSVGASGDLAPLAHLALALVGEGEGDWNGRRLPSGEELRAAGLSPAVLEAKEGLALINGTQLTTALGALGLYRFLRLLMAADLVAAL